MNKFAPHNFCLISVEPHLEASGWQMENRSMNYLGLLWNGSTALTLGMHEMWRQEMGSTGFLVWIFFVNAITSLGSTGKATATPHAAFVEFFSEGIHGDHGPFAGLFVCGTFGNAQLEAVSRRGF